MQNFFEFRLQALHQASVSLVQNHLTRKEASNLTLLFLLQHSLISRWLFVASSDGRVSKLACYDMFWLYGGKMEPIAEAYLPGVVETAQIEVQPQGLVLALGLDGV